MKGTEIRKRFLDFFEEKGHRLVPSSPLVPQGDPTLLFTNAGMVQFKSVFLGDEKRDYSKAATVQKCLRAGGKHNDLENVGRTARHHTFFEMLGNFSFGDYFKEEAINLAWDFLTKEIKLTEDRLWITIFEDDDEAAKIWQKKTNLPKERIVRCGEKDNFWSMGDTGPCGPCSEIHYDQGEEVGCGRSECNVECDCDRYLEIWNLVFMQFNRDAAGEMTPLPKPSIDTGMGLERLAAVVQEKTSNYDTDLFSGIFKEIENLSGKKYGEKETDDVSIRVIADHIRSTVFLVADGVLPSNEGRGYVLRRIMRRAARHGKLLGLSEPFLCRLTDAVAAEFGDAYPELTENSAFLNQVILSEEERFLSTLDHGLKLLEEELAKLRGGSKKVLPGDVAFKLYDTFGFPLDLTEDILKSEGMAVEMAGFDQAMEKQKTQARQSWTGSGEGQAAHVYTEILQKLAEKGTGEVEFTGYDRLTGEGTVLFILKSGEVAESAKEGEVVEIVTNKSPFYGESGGQKGDAGILRGGNGLEIKVIDTLKPLPGLIVHQGEVKRGEIAVGGAVKLEVDGGKRQSTARNHTATHLLQSALKQVLGNHIKQSGSLVESGRLRFDFSHFSAMTDDELKQVGEIVNSEIWKDAAVSTEELTIDEAKVRGATALFGEKYGDRVRVVTVPGFSMELCGGTHVKRAGEIGPFRILSEGGIAAGVRRIEAVTGAGAYTQMMSEKEELDRIAGLVKGQSGEVAKKVEGLVARQKALESEVEKLKAKLASSGGGKDLMSEVVEVGGVKLLSVRIDGTDAKSLRGLMDDLKAKIKSGIVVLGSPDGDKVLLIAGVTADLTDMFHAGKIVGQIAPIVGGKGGGRPDMAQAGGKDVSKLDEALGAVKGIVEKVG